MSTILRFLAVLVPSLFLALIADGIVSGLSPSRPLDPFLVLTVLLAANYAWRGDKVAGMVAGALIGLTQDALLSTVFGVHCLSKLVVGYVTTLAALRLLPHQPLTQAVLLGGATVLELGVIFVTGMLLDQHFVVRSPGETLALFLGNVVAGSLLFLAVARWRSQRDGRRAHASRGGR